MSVAVDRVVVVELGLISGLEGLVDFHLLVALARRFLEFLFENLVAEDGEEECMDHFGNEPHFGDFFQGVHADSHALLSGRDNGRVRGAHLVDVHDKGGE